MLLCVQSDCELRPVVYLLHELIVLCCEYALGSILVKVSCERNVVRSANKAADIC